MRDGRLAVVAVPSVYVGLVTRAFTPSARQAPRTNVVLPDPELAGDRDDVARAKRRRSRAPAASVASGLSETNVCAIRRGRAARPAPARARAPAVLRLVARSGCARRASRSGRRAKSSSSTAACSACRAPPPGDRADRAAPAGRRAHVLRLAVHAGDADLLAREQLRREVAERRDDARLDQLDLPEEVRLAGLDLVGHGVAVAGRAALDDVRDVDVGARRARCPRAACRGACRPGRRTGSPACPRGSPAPRRRTSGRRSGRRRRTRPACALRRAGSACSRRLPLRAPRAWRDAPP